jgi:hypothetical protein
MLKITFANQVSPRRKCIKNAGTGLLENINTQKGLSGEAYTFVHIFLKIIFTLNFSTEVKSSKLLNTKISVIA